MSDLYDVLEEKEQDNYAQERVERWKEKQKANRTFCYETIEKELLEVAQSSEKFGKYLDMQSSFDQYSARNTLLIMNQRPNATKLGDTKHWKEQRAFIKKTEWNNPILILEPGDEYEKEDGGIGQYYNPKELYDVSQTTARKRITPEIQMDDRLLIRALIHDAPVSVIPMDQLPQAKGESWLDPDNKRIFIQKGLDGPSMFVALAKQLAKYEMLHEEFPGELEFAAASSAYILAKRYGVKDGLEKIDLSKMPKSFAKMEAQDVGAELSIIRDTANRIENRMRPVIERERAQKEPER